MQHRLIKAGLASLTAVVLTLGVAACSSGSPADSASSGTAISAKRCEENKAAGTITYLSGYQFQSSASILEYVAASKLGYFSDLCLNVQLKPGTGDSASRLLSVRRAKGASRAASPSRSGCSR